MARDERSAPCGTEAAYNRHRRHGETPCQECKRAAAQARARRRGKDAKNDVPMGEHLTQAAVPSPAAPEGVPLEELDFKTELTRLYGVLGVALTKAAPRETASIVKEMRGVIHDIRAEMKAQPTGPGLKEQLAQAKRDRAAKEEARRRERLAGKDAGEETA